MDIDEKEFSGDDFDLALDPLGAKRRTDDDDEDFLADDEDLLPLDDDMLGEAAGFDPYDPNY